MEEVGLIAKDFSALLEDVKRMLLRKPSLPVEVVLEERYIWFARIRLREELGVGRDAHSRSLDLSPALPFSPPFTQYHKRKLKAYLFDDTLLRADREAILELVLGEINLRDRTLVLDLVNGLLNLRLCAAHRVVSAARRSVVKRAS